MGMNKKYKEFKQTMQEEFEKYKEQHGKSDALAFTIDSFVLYAKNLDFPCSSDDYLFLKSFGSLIYSHLDEIQDAIELGIETKKLADKYRRQEA